MHSLLIQRLAARYLEASDVKVQKAVVVDHKDGRITQRGYKADITVELDFMLSGRALAALLKAYRGDVQLLERDPDMYGGDLIELLHRDTRVSKAIWKAAEGHVKKALQQRNFSEHQILGMEWDKGYNTGGVEKYDSRRGKVTAWARLILHTEVDSGRSEPLRYATRSLEASDLKIHGAEIVSGQEPDSLDDEFGTTVTLDFTLSGKLLASLLGKQQRVMDRALDKVDGDQILRLLGHRRGLRVSDAILKKGKWHILNAILDYTIDELDMDARILQMGWDENTDYASVKVDTRRGEVRISADVLVMGEFK